MEEFDSLTRLPARGLFQLRLEQEIARAQRYGLPLALLLAEIDDFDSLLAVRGREAMDTVLCRVALLCLTAAREADIVARTGDHAFGLLLPDTEPCRAEAYARRIASEAAVLDLSKDDSGLFVRLSVGVAAYGPQLSEGAALWGRAQEMLEAARLHEDGAGARR